MDRSDMPNMIKPAMPVKKGKAKAAKPAKKRVVRKTTKKSKGC